MCHIRREYTLLILLAFNLLLTNIVVAKESAKVNSKVTIVLDEWAPYISSDRPFKGRLPHIVSAAFELQNIRSAYKFVDWDLAYQRVINNKDLLSIGWLKDASRSKEVLYSDPISHITLSLFHRQNLTFRWQQLDDLKVYRIGVVKNHSYGTEFNKIISNKSYKFSQFDSLEDAFKALRTDKIDLLPADQAVGQLLIQMPNEIHTPGIFVQRIFQGVDYEKRIEQRTVRQKG